MCDLRLQHLHTVSLVYRCLSYSVYILSSVEQLNFWQMKCYGNSLLMLFNLATRTRRISCRLLISCRCLKCRRRCWLHRSSFSYRFSASRRFDCCRQNCFMQCTVTCMTCSQDDSLKFLRIVVSRVNAM